jgi:hypothetical protein
MNKSNSSSDDNEVIAIVFLFDKLFPDYSNNTIAQNTVDIYNKSITILDNIHSKFSEHVDLYLYTTQQINLATTKINNTNNKKVSITAKNRILDILPYFKNIIYKTSSQVQQYIIDGTTQAQTNLTTASPYYITDSSNYLDEIKSKYAKVFIYGEEKDSSATNVIHLPTKNSTTNNSNIVDTIISLISEEVILLKNKYYKAILKVAQKFKKEYRDEVTTFVSNLTSIDSTYYAQIYLLLNYIYANYKLYNSVIRSIPDELKSNIATKFELVLPTNTNINALYNTYVTWWITFLTTNIAVLLKSYYPLNQINYHIDKIVSALKNNKHIEKAKLEELEQIIHYITNFYKYEIPGINPEYIYGYDAQKCSEHNINCGALYNSLTEAQKTQSKQLYYAFVDYVTQEKNNDYYTALVASAPSGILKLIRKKISDNKKAITSILINYISSKKNINIPEDYYATNDEKYLLSLVANAENNDALNKLSTNALYTLYNYLRRCDFLNYLSANKSKYSNLYDFALSIPHETPNPVYGNLGLWINPFNNIFRIQRDKLFRFVEPYENINLLSNLDANKEIVKMSSGSGAFRVKYTGDNSTLKGLFIKGYEHNGLFDPTNINKRFAVSFLKNANGNDSNTQLCISNTRIFNEIIMNYLMKKITETDANFNSLNNIHTYDFIYTPDDDTVYIAQPAIGLKASIADGETITTLKDLLYTYYGKLKRELKAVEPEHKSSQGTKDITHDNLITISKALCDVLSPYLETLALLKSHYKFVHTDLHFGNIFIKQNPVVASEDTSELQTIHSQLITDLKNCVLLVADYDLARMTIKPELFNDSHIKQIKLMAPSVEYVDFKSIFIEDKAIEEQAKDINIVPKEKKKLQKKETVIRTRCAYDKYDLHYETEEKKDADMLIYSNWDILSIFINVIAFLKKCEHKIYGHESGVEGYFTSVYQPIISLFQKYVITDNAKKVGNDLMHVFYACVCKIYSHKKIKNWVRLLFEGKFSIITRVFEKFKGDYDKILANVDDYKKFGEPNKTTVKTVSNNPDVPARTEPTTQQYMVNTMSVSEQKTKKKGFFAILAEKFKTLLFRKKSAAPIPPKQITSKSSKASSVHKDPIYERVNSTKKSGEPVNYATLEFSKSRSAYNSPLVRRKTEYASIKYPSRNKTSKSASNASSVKNSGKYAIVNKTRKQPPPLPERQYTKKTSSTKPPISVTQSHTLPLPTSGSQKQKSRIGRIKKISQTIGSKQFAALKEIFEKKQSSKKRSIPSALGL